MKNYTPHAVTIYKEDGITVVTEIPPEKHSYRLKEDRIPMEGNRCGIPWVSPAKYVNLEPAPTLDDRESIIIVSQFVAQWIQENNRSFFFKEVYAPDTGPTGVVRDQRTGKILGVKRLIKYI